jgi:hypothetical protein
MRDGRWRYLSRHHHPAQLFGGALAGFPAPQEGRRLETLRDWGLAPSTMRTATMLAAWTFSASSICWYWGA